MSEGEVARLSTAIADLSRKSDRQHEENQRAAAADREAFSKAMHEQRQAFQEALNKQFLLHVDLDKKTDANHVLLAQCIGTGQPGEGRLGVAEEAIETLKKFRWQALAIVSLVLLAAEHAREFLPKP